MSEKKVQQGVLFPLLLLTFFFVLMQVSFFIQCNRVYLSDYTFVSNNLHIPWIIYPELFRFVGIVLGLHLLGCLLIWGIVEAITRNFSFLRKRKFGFAIVFWCWCVLTLLVANQYYFPGSKFAALTSTLLPTLFITKVVFLFLLMGLGLAFLGIVGKRVWLLPLLAMAVYLVRPSSPIPELSMGTSKQPNVIIIGVDSLRPDFLGFFGRDNATPFFDTFLSSATVFGEAVTPLARTFPSWTGILTGEYPRQIGIRSNLMNTEAANLDDTLPAILQRHGYETIYATDEVRFSNIDKNFGFSQIITPPMGLNDFLLGNFNDFPATNLLVNTAVGQWLFPHSYGNRAVYFTYRPASFLKMIAAGLEKASLQAKPLFLAAHFCLPHHTWLWASLHAEKLNPQQRYLSSVSRVDRQLKDFFTLLSLHHLLDHAIIVVLSDHGEALAFEGDRLTENDLYSTSAKPVRVPPFYPSSVDEEAINQSAGHGTDVLSLPQYHTMLAFQLRGLKERNKAQVIAGVVSLLDIKPTVLRLLGMTPTRSSGISLADYVKGASEALPLRHFFLESDYSPAAIRTVYPALRDVYLEGIDLFEIDKVKARLTIKKSMVQKIIKSKQLADIYGEWMLALYPQDQRSYTPILINLNTGYWTDDLYSEFAHNTPALSMLSALKDFYATELAGANIKPFYSQSP